MFLINIGPGAASHLPGGLRHPGDFSAHRRQGDRAGDFGGAQGWFSWIQIQQ